MRPPLTFLLALSLTAVALAGCIGPDGAPTQAAVPEERLEDATVPGYRPNVFLLDEPRPFHTRVSWGAEPSILADHQGQYLWIGDTSGLHRSADGGQTWTELSLPWIALTCDGLTVAQDDVGAFYAANTGCAHIYTARSTDGGDSWDNVQAVADAAPIADRPWITARGDGEVALVFYDFGRTLSETCLRSTDGGATFLDRSVLQSPPNAGNVVYGPEGSLAYATGTTLYYRPSGQCLAPLYRLPMLNGIGDTVFTQAAASPAGLFVAGPTQDNAGVQVAGTQDKETVERIVLEPQDPSTGASLATNTFVTISATADEVAVAWYGSETEGDASDPDFDGSWNVFVARIHDFWSASPWVQYDRITDEPNHVGQLCMGGIGCDGDDDRDLLDYFGIDHGPDGTLHIAYGHDGDSTVPQVHYARLPALP